MRGPAPHAEGSRDRAAHGLATRTGGFPALDGARARRAGARAAVADAGQLEEHVSTIAFGEEGGVPNRDYGEPAVELLDDPREPTVGEEELELLRILAGTPRFGREIDERVLPAEAGLTERAISFTKGCYPGQEPVARLHYRGHANRALRVFELDGDEVPGYDADVLHAGKAVGRVTSAARRPVGGVVALAYIRVEVPEEAELRVGRSIGRPLDWALGRP